MMKIIWKTERSNERAICKIHLKDWECAYDFMWMVFLSDL